MQNSYMRQKATVDPLNVIAWTAFVVYNLYRNFRNFYK